MPSTICGSCLCGKARFSLTGDYAAFFLCYCSRCRKDTGSAHAANIFVRAASLIWQGNTDTINTYNHDNCRHVKSFCTHCGSALPTQIDSTTALVPAGSLDEEPPIPAGAKIFFADRADWVDPDAPTFDGFPPQQ